MLLNQSDRRYYNIYQLVVKELWLCIRKRTSTSGCALGIGPFTAIIPRLPVDNYIMTCTFFNTLRRSIIVIMSIHCVHNSGKLHGEKTFVNNSYYIGNKTAFHRSRETMEYYYNTNHIIYSLLSFKINTHSINSFLLPELPAIQLHLSL